MFVMLPVYRGHEEKLPTKLSSDSCMKKLGSVLLEMFCGLKLRISSLLKGRNNLSGVQTPWYTISASGAMWDTSQIDIVPTLSHEDHARSRYIGYFLQSTSG